MSIVLSILFWIAVGFGGLLPVLLLVPFDARARGVIRDARADGEARVRWGGGVVAVRWSRATGGELRVLGLCVARFSGGQQREREEKRGRANGRTQWGSGVAAWRNRRVLLCTFARLFRTLHLRGRVTGSVGLSEPTDTAAVHGLITTLRATVRQPEILVECNYLDEVVDLEGFLRAFLWPIEVVIVGLAMLARRDLRRALREMREGKRRVKEATA